MLTTISSEPLEGPDTTAEPSDAPAAVRVPGWTAPVAASSLLVAAAACGGDGGGPGGVGSGAGSSGGAGVGGGGTGPDAAGSELVPAAVPVQDTLPTEMQAARFLQQAAMASTPTDIARVQAIGCSAWLDEQFAAPRAFSLWDWMVSRGYATASAMNTQQGIEPALWRSLIAGSDTLRQRIALALSEILVVGIDGLNISWRAFAAAAWMDLLLDNAFGNFRTLLEQMSRNAAMGVYLTFRGNRRANVTTGAQPDENYARELMQLFTLGLYELQPDGAPKTVAGQPVETYEQADIMGLARVFTGWDFDGNDNTTPDRLRRPMTIIANRHETGDKRFLGTTIAAGTDGARSLGLALDTIFAHPNVGPFIGHQLIQRLVTSNPSAAYVGRVAAAFADNGGGVRGDLQAVVRAVLLDPEARADPSGDPLFGKMREPILRLTGWARVFGVGSASDAWAIGNTSDPATRLGQSPLRSPSVFNFFRPGYVPPGSSLGAHGKVAPELQITNESSAVGYVNFMQTMVSSGLGDVKADYSMVLPLADTPDVLLARLNLWLAAGQLSASTVAQISAAIATIAGGTAAGRRNRLHAALTLVLATPEYVVLK